MCDNIEWHPNYIQERDSKYHFLIGDEIWDLNMGEGHRIVEYLTCDQHYCGACGGLLLKTHYVWKCECGYIIDWVDLHDVRLLRRL